MPSQIDNVIIQVRAHLQNHSIKLWLEPYHHPVTGCAEAEIDKLAGKISTALSIPVSNCRSALSELQDAALRKLASRKEFEETGVATFSIRVVNNEQGTQSIFEIKCPLSAFGSVLHKKIACKLMINDENRVKILAGGKILSPQYTLSNQCLQNNQHLMVVISQMDEASTSKDAVYDRIRKIKRDVESIVDSSRNLFEMEDQDGNPIFLPPDENRALLIAMGYCEKARASMRNLQYDEALILLLEADEKFTTCNSKFLESVDNYALVNLDIVWCYLCLKNITQLPDANRRLDICEQNFRRSYGENFTRLFSLKGKGAPELALIMRLHLLQGVLLFHQNRRNEAYEKIELAANELRELKVDETDVANLVEMGYESFDARIALRACRGNIGEAVNFIYERKKKIKNARKNSEKERYLDKKLAQSSKNNKDWVNPRSVNSMIEMGFPRELVVSALRASDNDLEKSLDLLKSNSAALYHNLPLLKKADENLVAQLKVIGFKEDMARLALETSQNNIENSLDFLMRAFNDEDELLETMEQVAKKSENAAILCSENMANSAGPSTSNAGTTNNNIFRDVMRKAQHEIESLQAYKRFNKDLPENENDYLDLPLIQEEQLLVEYKRLLEQ